MSRLRKGVILVAASALTISMAASAGLYWTVRRELQAARRDVSVLTTANEFLKKSLGELTIAITARDRQIDSMFAVCGGEGKPLSSAKNQSESIRRQAASLSNRYS